MQTRKATQEECLYSAFLSQDEPKVEEEALKDADWVLAMQEELNRFERNKVWKLVPKPKTEVLKAQNGFSETKWMRMELSQETRKDW